MIARIKPSSVGGSVYAPSSKSFAHRLLICAALSDGESTVSNVTFSEDILATLDCLKTMGAEYLIDGDKVIIKGIKNICLKESNDFYCRESGSTIRFILPLLLLSDTEQVMHGKGRLMSRPMKVYEDICLSEGLKFEQTDVITIKGKLKNGIYSVPGNISSQFITGLIYALTMCEGESIINIIEPFESSSYVNITLDALKLFGAVIEAEKSTKIVIHGGNKLKAQNITVEGDFSGAAFLDVFNHIGGNVDVKGLNYNSLQGDKIYLDYFKQLDDGTPELDISDCPDLAPVLMTLAVLKNGCILNNTRRLKIKESDRGVVMAEELAKFGADIVLEENRIIINKSELFAPKKILCGHNDHRIVMSLAVISTIYGGEITDAEAVSKSFPEFFDTIKLLNAKVELYAD